MNDDPARRAEQFRRHFDAAQFRSDTWNELKHNTARLEQAARAHTPEARELKTDVLRTLETLDQIERYWAFPGQRVVRDLRRFAERGWHGSLARQTSRVVRLLVSEAYRHRRVADIAQEHLDSDARGEPGEGAEAQPFTEKRPYFEKLIVDEMSPEEEVETRRRVLAMRSDDDAFTYDVVIVSSLEDAIIAILFNHNIQSCVIRYRFPFDSGTDLPELRRYVDMVDIEAVRRAAEADPSAALAATIRELRPEVDLFLVTDDPIADVAGHTGRDFRRIFYQHEDYLDLHLSVLRGILERYETPFFGALRQYSQKPTGVFHAMPISRGKSIAKSHWIGDMGDFYDKNIFLAETSATTGGLDSLLHPTGPLKHAQEKMSRAFGSHRSYFATNGTSTANKIVMQALIRPGDIVLVSRDCHKSHHYSLVLSGGQPVYMDPYPLEEYSMYGGVTLDSIKRHLLALKRAGKLDRVRMVLLTNCTFDGVVYDPERVMREVLAIKPDVIFLWDEAWFAFARFSPTYRSRTAMQTAKNLEHELESPEYRERYDAWRRDFDPSDDGAWLRGSPLPDPDRVRVRVYATQSTHKTLTSLRQGSMIHVYDQEFERSAERMFDEAFMTHTSTSPNYQILASLDVGRRQVELEGYELVKESVQLAMTLRERLTEHPLLRKWFDVLSVGELIPEQCRPSKVEAFYSPTDGFRSMEAAWDTDEFALDPTRVTLYVGKTGIDGDTFRKLLHEKYDIQVNKTSRNTVLFMLNIGTTRGAVAYLLEVLLKIAREVEDDHIRQSAVDAAIDERRIKSLVHDRPPLPNFSHFHAAFTDRGGKTPEGDIRTAFFMAAEESNCEYVPLNAELARAVEGGREFVSASFVTPYPPGFPVLVPGQVVTRGILDYLLALDVKEIHGYEPEHGLRVLTEKALGKSKESRRAASVAQMEAMS